MINEVENKVSLDKMSDLEFGKNKLEMMRYRANSLSYMLGFLAIFMSLFGGFICFNSMNAVTWVVLLKIAINVIIVLFGFLCCERAKSYNAKGSLILVALGVLNVVRIFWIPIYLMRGQAALNAGKTSDLVGNVVDVNLTKITGWLPADGNFRAVLAIIFFVLAAVAFITAGVIGYIRSKKLSTYLSSINVKI